MRTRRDILATAAASLAAPQISLAQQSVAPWAYNRATAKAARTVLAPTNADEAVSAFVEAKRSQGGFAIRSGGHCFEGFSQHDALQIDMGALSGIEWASDDVITAGPGATIGDVNQFLGPTGHVLPAGFCQGVALGGHISGGGVGLYARRFGLAADHLVSAQVVLANGALVEASEASHPDLFWALKGGGAGSFGLVTSYSLRVRKVPRTALLQFVWDGSAAELAPFLADWHRLAESLPRAFGAVMFLRHMGAGRMVAELYLQSTAADETTRDLAGRIYALRQPVADPDVKIGPPHQIADAMWSRGHNPAENVKIMSDYLKEPVPTVVWLRFLEQLAISPTLETTVALDLLGGAVDDLEPSATPYPHRGTGQMLAQFILDLRDKDPSDQLARFRSLKDTLADYASGGGYSNYPDRELRDYASRYWGENLPRLQSVKAKYDPENLFRHPQSVPLPS